MPNNYAVMSDYPEEGSIKFFPTEPEAAAYAHTIIKAAEDLCDVDGYPKFIRDVLILRVQAEIQNSPDGLILAWR